MSAPHGQENEYAPSGDTGAPSTSRKASQLAAPQAPSRQHPAPYDERYSGTYGPPAFPAVYTDPGTERGPIPYYRHHAPYPGFPIQHAGYAIGRPHSGQEMITYTSDVETKPGDRVRRQCFNCRTIETATWRRSNLSPGKVVCNRCGLYERTHLRPRPERFVHKREREPLPPPTLSGPIRSSKNRDAQLFEPYRRPPHVPRSALSSYSSPLGHADLKPSPSPNGSKSPSTSPQGTPNPRSAADCGT